MPGSRAAGLRSRQATSNSGLRGGEPAGPLGDGDVVGEDVQQPAGGFVGRDQRHLDRDVMAVGMPGRPLHPLIPGVAG